MKARHAFTLVELLVVIVIITLLVALLIPTLQRTKELSNRTVCRSNMRIFNGSILQYASDNNGWGTVTDPAQPNTSPSSEYPHWQKRAGPYYGMPFGTPDSKQPWYGTTACPSYRRGNAIMQTTLAFAINYKLPDTNLYMIGDPARVFLTMEGKYASGTSNIIVYAFAACRGDMNGQIVGTYPRHLAEGLNWGFVDGHVQWMDYYRAPTTGLELFLPSNPKAQ